MGDILRVVEFCELVGDHRRAELGPKKIQHGAYIDTGAGKTVISEAVARSVHMPKTPTEIEYAVPIKTRVKTRATGMRLVLDGCERFLPMLVAVSDKVIRALELPGVEVLVGQDYLQTARVRIDLAPKRDEQKLVCRRVAVRKTGEAWAVKVKGAHWYISGPNVERATGSVRVGQRPPSIADLQVGERGRGTGTALLERILGLFRDLGEREFVTTGQTSEGDAFFRAMERRGVIEKAGERKERWGIEHRYRF